MADTVDGAGSDTLTALIAARERLNYYLEKGWPGPIYGLALDLLAKLEKSQAALRAAHHELNCVHGLWATDREPDHAEEGGPDIELFQLNKLWVLKKIEEAMDA